MEAFRTPYQSLKVSESRSAPSTSFDEEHALEDTLSYPPTKGRHRLLSLLPRLVVVLFAIWGFLSLLVTVGHRTRSKSIDIYRPATLPKDYNHCDCGSTVAEARAKGCKYDSMGAAWLPDYCRDDELTATFAQSGTELDGSWPYYADADGAHRISIEDIAALGKGSFYATRYWHVAHCLFYWEKYVRMRETGTVMEARFDRVKHTQHCRKLALKENADPHLLIAVEVAMNSQIDDLKGAEQDHSLHIGRLLETLNA